MAVMIALSVRQIRAAVICGMFSWLSCPGEMVLE